jgi:hypothetical protein
MPEVFDRPSWMFNINSFKSWLSQNFKMVIKVTNNTANNDRDFFHSQMFIFYDVNGS